MSGMLLTRPVQLPTPSTLMPMKRDSSLMQHSRVQQPGRLPEECQVCGTSANVRKNFGVPSCVSCRIFYSRNTGKQLVCYQNGNCRIEGPSRKSCAACRFKKCMKAGMQKSRERKYKYRKNALEHAKGLSEGKQVQSLHPHHQDAEEVQQQQHMHHQQRQQQQQQQQQQSTFEAVSKMTAGYPPLDLFKDIGGLDNSVMDKNLFVHFYKMADMFRVPFDCSRTALVVRDTLSGLSLLEAVTKRTLAILRFLPHFSSLDRTLVSAMVSEKISGLISILRALHYQPTTRLMSVRCAPTASSSTAVATEDSSSLSSSSSSSPSSCCDESTVQQPLLHIINGLFVDLTLGDRPMMTDAEVTAVYLATLHLYNQCDSLFRDRLNIGVTLLLGMYFFLPDYKTVQLDEEELRGYQSLYLRCLQDLLKVLSRDPSEAMDMYNRCLFLLTEVKSVDFYLSLLSRHVRFRSN